MEGFRRPRAHRPRHGQGRDPGPDRRESLRVVQDEGRAQADIAADGGEGWQGAETPRRGFRAPLGRGAAAGALTEQDQGGR